MRNKLKTRSGYGDVFFPDVEIIRTSRFSHYLVQKETMLEINAMKSVYFGMKEILNDLDELDRLEGSNQAFERFERIVKIVAITLIIIAAGLYLGGLHIY